MKKRNLIILILALVVILGGAYLLYNKLSSKVDADQIAVEGSPARTEQVSSGDAEKNTASNAESSGTQNTESPAGNTGNTASDDKQGSAENTGNASSDDKEKTEIKAPDFTVQDAEGNKVKLSDLFGKPIVLNFWASWCGPCQAEMPEFDEACSELEGQVIFMMVNITDGSRETIDTAKKFISQKGFSFPVYFDTTTEAAYIYGISSIPATYFIDSSGSLIARAVGTLDRETLDRGIAMITE